MTVAAVILAASIESALADVEGVPRVRRLADVAWSGGAVPITVVAPDPEGAVQAALAGAPVTYVEPAPTAAGPVGQIVRGIEAAMDEVKETDAAIVWPARMQWIDAETITSLIEAHGQHPGFVLRPTYDGDAGWPVLIPRSELPRLRGIAPDRMPPDVIQDLFAAGAVEWRIDLGDPGATHDASVARADLPPYLGPPGPASGHHEWGAAAAADASAQDEGPLEGPALAPFGQASEAEDPAIDVESGDPARPAARTRLEP
jgi:CTP:molybdopterin cytidylyltransferase MocA